MSILVSRRDSLLDLVADAEFRWNSTLYREKEKEGKREREKKNW